MATLQDYRNERLRKLETLRQLGVEPYPAKSERTHTCAEVLSKYDELAGKEVVVAGRVASIRSFGKLAFIKLRDQSGDVQLYLQRDDVAELDAARGVLGMKQLKLLDTGDFIEAKGVMTTTQTGEKSVGVRELRLLTKSLRPMPENNSNKKSISLIIAKLQVDLIM
jgi:lysyl-tRNA synthetase, class II